MIEQQTTIEAKTGQQFTVAFANRETIQAKGFGGLDILYATNLWAGAWKELLVDASGKQYGTYDAEGKLYDETAQLLTRNNIDVSLPNWPQIAWQLAGEGRFVDLNGQQLSQFWTLEKAQAELMQFVESAENGGFGGEIMTIQNSKGEIAGFTAYTVTEPNNGPQLTQKRFEYSSLLVDGTVVEQTLERFLTTQYPGRRFGILLDFAIAENHRGEGLGSTLFDMRMDILIDMGADIVIGRTIKTSPAQYFGNYKARGMQEIALDPANTDKAIFVVGKHEIVSRDAKTRRK